MEHEHVKPGCINVVAHVHLRDGPARFTVLRNAPGTPNAWTAMDISGKGNSYAMLHIQDADLPGTIEALEGALDGLRHFARIAAQEDAEAERQVQARAAAPATVTTGDCIAEEVAACATP